MAEFKHIRYKLDWKPEPVEVSGYAFETPGWPEFHACVRFGSRFDINDDDIFNNWIVDHYESGLAICLPTLKRRSDAPAAVAKRLEEVGREKVHDALKRQGLTW